MGQPTPTQAGGQSGLRGSKGEPNQPDRATPLLLGAPGKDSTKPTWCLALGWALLGTHNESCDLPSEAPERRAGQIPNQRVCLRGGHVLGAVGAQDGREVVVVEEALRDM